MYLRAMVLAAFALSIPMGLWAQNDPFLGSWKRKENPTHINKYEPAGKGQMKVTVSRITKGVPNSHSRIEIYDGKPHPVEGEDGSFGTIPTDAVSVRRIDSHTIAGENWYQGKVRARYTVTVSPDGKTLTKKIKGVRDGQPYEEVRVSVK